MDINPYTLVQWNGTDYREGKDNPRNIWGYVSSIHPYLYMVRWLSGTHNTYLKRTLIINTKSWT